MPTNNANIELKGFVESNILPEGSNYEYSGVDEKGRILYRTKSGSIVKVDPTKDFNQVLSEAFENGIFVNDNSVEANPQGIVMRCEFIFELWRMFDTDGSVGESSYSDYQDFVDEVCGSEAYYKYAFAWLLSLNPDKLSNLYSFRDMQGAITWLEVSYILYLVVELKKSHNWVSQKPPSSLRVSFLTVERDGVKTIEDSLPEYKGRFTWMKSYISAITEGVKPLPLPVFWTLIELERKGFAPDMPGYVWCVSEVSRKDISVLLNSVDVENKVLVKNGI